MSLIAFNRLWFQTLVNHLGLWGATVVVFHGHRQVKNT